MSGGSPTRRVGLATGAWTPPLVQYPFRILGFHADNGSGYINHVVAGLLEKLRVEFTKSRARQTNDQALVEGTDGVRVDR